MIKAVVLDIGGVILRTEDRSGRIGLEKRYNLPIGGADKLVFNSKSAYESTIGQVGDQAVWDNVVAQLSLSSKELDDFKHDFWSGDIVDENLLKFLGSLRENYKTALLSNAWKNFRSVLSQVYNITEGKTVDKILISSELGVAKPNPQIYQILAKTIDTEFTEILFVDDFVENIQVAQELGIHTIHYHSGIDLINEIKLNLNSLM